MKRTAMAMVCVALFCAVGSNLAAQTSRPPISTPSVVAPPTWWRVLHMQDGRTFVTDGGISIDAALAKPASLPGDVLPEGSAKIIAGNMTSPHEHEVRLDELKPATRPNTFETPNGVILNGNYVTLLRSVLPNATARLRTRGNMSPITIVVDGQPVGLMMPVAPPKK